MRPRTVLLVAGLVVLLVGAAAATTVTTATTTETAPTSGTTASSLTSEPLRLTTTLSLTPETPGTVLVVARYDVPPRVESLRTTPPVGATVVETTDFVHRSDGTYAWRERTVSPTLIYRFRANETASGRIPLAAQTDGRYILADPGPWALVRTPPMSTRWEYRGHPVDLERRTTVDGEGAVGDQLAFLGPHETYRREATGQTFTLVVPSAANLTTSPAAILDSMGAASSALDVGERDPSVFVVAAPTTGPAWATRGIELGGTDAWVAADEPLASPENVWLHEYVHTRQTFTTTTETRWLTEATASYYAATLSLHQGLVGFDAFAAHLGVEGLDDVVLADPETWHDFANYRKGALVVGVVDLTLHSTEAGAFETVVSSLNDGDGPVSEAEFLDSVPEAGRETARRYTTSTETPTMWDRSTHRSAFGPFPAHVTVDLAAASGYRVSGAYRNGSLDERALLVVPNETVFVSVLVRNDGGSGGEYETTLVVDGEPSDRVTGRVDAGETTTVGLSHTFTATGNHRLTFGGRTVVVEVRDPAPVEVVDVVPTRPTAGGDESVTLSVTVENPAAVPGRASVPILVDDRLVERRAVTLGPNERRTLSLEVPVSDAESHRITVGDRSVVVGATTRSESELPGFGLVSGLAALVIGYLIRRWRGDRSN